MKKLTVIASLVLTVADRGLLRQNSRRSTIRRGRSASRPVIVASTIVQLAISAGAAGSDGGVEPLDPDVSAWEPWHPRGDRRSAGAHRGALGGRGLVARPLPRTPDASTKARDRRPRARLRGHARRPAGPRGLRHRRRQGRSGGRRRARRQPPDMGPRAATGLCGSTWSADRGTATRGSVGATRASAGRGPSRRPHEDGIPYQRPETVLLFKAKHTRRRISSTSKSVLPALEPADASVAQDALELVHTRGTAGSSALGVAEERTARRAEVLEHAVLAQRAPRVAHPAAVPDEEMREAAPSPPAARPA